MGAPLTIASISVLNYAMIFALMMTGMYILIATNNLVKKIIGLNFFQASVFILYISIGKVSSGTAPILLDEPAIYSNPLPHVLILTAIVVGVATTALGLALIVRIRSWFGTVDDYEIQKVRDDN